MNIICDVCDTFIHLSSNPLADYEDYTVDYVCPSCGYNNAYQIHNGYYNKYKAGVISNDLEFDINDACTDEVLMYAVIESYGITSIEVLAAAKAQEYLDRGFHIDRFNEE